MKVRTFINTLNPIDILKGRIRFKLITNDGYGDKWLFWYGTENHSENIKTIEDFLNSCSEGLQKALDLYIDFSELMPIQIEICYNDDCDYDILYRIYYTTEDN